MTTATLSICIPTYNRAAFLEALLGRISAWQVRAPEHSWRVGTSGPHMQFGFPLMRGHRGQHHIGFRVLRDPPGALLD